MLMMGCGFGGKLAFIWSLIVTGKVKFMVLRSLVVVKGEG